MIPSETIVRRTNLNRLFLFPLLLYMRIWIYVWLTQQKSILFSAKFYVFVKKNNPPPNFCGESFYNFIIDFDNQQMSLSNSPSF